MSLDRDVENDISKLVIIKSPQTPQERVPDYVRTWCKENCETYGGCDWNKSNCQYYNNPQWIKEAKL